MNKAYAINYDLKAPGRDYQSLYDAIKKQGRWWHYLESTWLIITDRPAYQIWADIHPTIDQNDYVLIIEVRNDVQGWLPKDAWDWISANVPK